MTDTLVQTVLIPCLLVILTALAGAVAVVIKNGAVIAVQYMNAKMGTDRASALRSFIDDTVKALEQSPAFASLDGAGKKTYALSSISSYATAHGVPITSQELEVMIEASVHAMNLGTSDWFTELPDADTQKKILTDEIAKLLVSHGVTLPADAVAGFVGNVYDAFLNEAKAV